MSSRNFRSGPSAPNRSVAPFHRGPQAQMTPVPTAGSGYAPVMTKNAALLIDFDNVTMGIRSDLHSELKNLLSSDIIKGKPAVQRAYADWRRYPQYIVPLTESSIDLIFAPAYGTSKKNATDIRLAIDALELVFTRPDVTTFILLSGDSDFSSLVIKLKEYGKYVIGVGIRESSSDLLVMNCDEYYSYNALAGLVKTTEEESTRWDPWALVTEAVTRMKRNGDVMRSDRLKQVMQEIDNSFDEKNLGHPKFSRFVQEAASKGLLSVTKLESGQLEVDAPEGDAAAAPAADGAAEGRSETRPDRARGERTERTERTDRPERERGERERDEERRGRRGRRGRGRDRGERGEGEGAEGEVTETEVAAAAGMESVATPAFEAPSFGAAVGGAVGTSGDRLTRSEAFDLVRQAVESLVQGDDATSASATRQRAFELLGRDSESLSARNFDRVLQDAHDAGMIDLRRRGDDFEVARAAEAASIVEQLKTAEGAAKASEAAKSPAAPTHRGMSHRGVAGRGAGRGKGMTPPPELLMVGVVPRTGGAVVAGNGTSTTASTPAAGASAPATESATATTSTAVADASAPGADVTAATEAAGAATAAAPARGARGGTRGAKTAAPARPAKTPAKRAAKEAAPPAAPAAKRPAKAAKSAAQAPAPAAAKKAAKGAKKAAKTARR